MSTEEVVRIIKGNVGKKVKAHPHPPSTTPAILLVAEVSDEGFTGYNLSDPVLINPTLMTWTFFADIADIQPVEAR